MYLDIGQPRRDGKFPVVFLSGMPGRFSRLSKLLTPAALVEALDKHGTPEQHEQFKHLRAIVAKQAERRAESAFLEGMN